MSQDHIRVIRIYEFTGPRDVVEAQLAKSIQGEKALTNGLVIKAATLGLYPEILTPDAQITALVEVPKELPKAGRLMVRKSAHKSPYVCGYLAVTPAGLNGTLPLREHYYISKNIEDAIFIGSYRESLAIWSSLADSGEFQGYSYHKFVIAKDQVNDQEQTTGILELTNQLEGSPRRYLAEQTDDTIARFEGRWYSTTDPRRARHFYNKAEAVGVWEELCRRPLPSHLRGMTAGSFHNRAVIIGLHEAQEKGE